MSEKFKIPDEYQTKEFTPEDHLEHLTADDGNDYLYLPTEWRRRWARLVFGTRLAIDVSIDAANSGVGSDGWYYSCAKATVLLDGKLLGSGSARRKDTKDPATGKMIPGFSAAQTAALRLALVNAGFEVEYDTLEEAVPAGYTAADAKYDASTKATAEEARKELDAILDDADAKEPEKAEPKPKRTRKKTAEAKEGEKEPEKAPATEPETGSEATDEKPAAPEDTETPEEEPAKHVDPRAKRNKFFATAEVDLKKALEDAGSVVYPYKGSGVFSGKTLAQIIHRDAELGSTTGRDALVYLAKGAKKPGASDASLASEFLLAQANKL